MLLKEADAAGLAQKQALIDRLKKDLTDAGIKFKEVGSTAIDIFNSVTVAQPIYTATATKFGGINVADKSSERLKSTKAPEGADMLYGKYANNGKLASLSTEKSPNSFKTSFYDYGGRTGQIKHYISNSITLVDSANISKTDAGQFLYGHMKYDTKNEVEYLGSIDVVEGGQVVPFTPPSKAQLKKDPAAAFDWEELKSEFYKNKNAITPAQLYQATVQYIIQTIDSTTINSAAKGGKEKYVIAPAKQLEAALEDLFDADMITSNLDTVANTNADYPEIEIDYDTGFKFYILVRRPSVGTRATETLVYNTDKTLLYNNVTANKDKLNDPKFMQLITKFVDVPVYEGKKLVFNYDAARVVKAIDQYIDDNAAAVEKAISLKAAYAEMSRKTAERNAARALQQQRDIARAEKLAARDEENRKKCEDAANDLYNIDAERREVLNAAKSKVNAGDLNKAIDDFTSDPDAYDSFLDRMVDKFS
jgi:hypothetical protein